MTVRELPRVEWKGKTYFWDAQLNQIRNVDNPHDFIDDPNIQYRHTATEGNGVRLVAYIPYVFSAPDKEPRFSTMDFHPDDHLKDLEKRVDFGEMVCIVDEEAGGIIAYAIGEEHAKMIRDALNK